MGEEEILAVIDEMKRRFSVDPDRVYIMGHSMGGAGRTWSGCTTRTTSAGSRCGDAAMWAAQPGPDWMAPQIAIQTAPKLYPNARNVDVFFKNAGAGIQRQSTEFADGIVEAGRLRHHGSLPADAAQFRRPVSRSRTS